MVVRASLLLILLGATALADTSPRSDSIDPRTFSLLREVEAPYVNHLSASGDYILSYSGGAPVLFNLNTKEKTSLDGQVGGIHDGHFSENGKFVVTAGYDGTTKVWDTSTGKELQSVGGHAGYA